MKPIIHILQHGQSNAVGTNGFDSSGAVKSITPLPGALMFRNGITAWQPDDTNPLWTEADKRAYFVAMIERKMGSDGETGMYGACQAFATIYNNENGISASAESYQLIGSGTGQGSKKASEIGTGSEYWQRIADDIHYARLRCVDGNFPSGGPERYAFGGKIITVAENDQAAQTPPTIYKCDLRGLSASIDAQVCAETGVDAVTPAIIYQPASHASNGVFNPEIALALLDLALEGGEFHLSTPCYHLPHADTVHLNALGQWRRGIHSGLALKRVIVDGIDWKPLYVTDHQRNDVWLELVFAGGAFDCPETVNGQIALVFDHAAVSAAIGKGFVLRNPDNTVNIFREAKAIGNKVILRYDACVQAGSILTYAVEGTGVGPQTGPRGNLRDNQGNKIIVGGYAVHNWCPMFRRTIT